MSLFRTPTEAPTSTRAAASGAPGRPLRDVLLPFTRRHRGMLGRGLLFTCVLVAARLALPIPLTQVVDRSASPGPAPAGPVALLSASFVVLALVAGMAEYLQRLAFAHFAGRSVSDIRAASLAKVQNPDDSVDLTTQVLGDCMRVKQGLKGVLNHITVNGLLVLGVCVALALTDLVVGLVVLAGAAAVGLVAVAGATRVGAVAARHRLHEVALAGSVHRLVAAEPGAYDDEALSALHELDAESGEADIAMTRWEGLTTWAAHTVLVVTAAAALLVGVHEVQGGRMSTGTLFGVMAYLLVLQGPAIRCARQITRTAPLLVSARELGGLLSGSTTAPGAVPDGRDQPTPPSR